MENKFEDSMQNVIGNQNYELSENSEHANDKTHDKIQSQLQSYNYSRMVSKSKPKREA
jgi:hypothetical protein